MLLTIETMICFCGNDEDKADIDNDNGDVNNDDGLLCIII